MVSTAPDAIDVVDFQFREHLRLKAFNNAAFGDPCNLVTVASRFGLIFIAGEAPELQVVQVKDIEGLSKEVTEFKRRTIPLQSKTLHISVNCDSTKLAVVIIKDNCPHVEFYDVLSFLKQTPKIINHTRLSANAASKVLQIDWNPALPDVFTAVKDDGSLLLYEFKGAPIELPPAANATCFCWSPKGKQLAVGSRDGKITQYKIDLKAVKAVEAPPGFGAIVSLCWVSSFQFFGVYKAGDEINLVCVDAPKAGAPVYTNYYDVCYSNGSARPEQFYLLHQLNWNMLFVASANSMEIAMLGMDASGKWTQWNLNDNCRAALPLGAKHEDTLPIGCALNVGATQYKVGDETRRGPALLVLSDHGTMVMFNAINARPGALDITSPLEAVADRTGESLFCKQANVAGVRPAAQLPPPVPQHPAIPQVAQQPVPPPQGQPLPQMVRPVATVTGLPPGTTVTQAQLPKVATNQVPVASQAPPPAPFVAAASATPMPAAAPPQNTHQTPPQAKVQSEPQASDKLPVTDETEAMIETLVREEFVSLESELRCLLQQGAAVATAQIGTEQEKKCINAIAVDLEAFYADVKENTHTHDGEVYNLKQHLLQSWACYEEAHTRVASLKDPVTRVLLQSMPLDPGTQHQQDEIDRYMYYIDSQLVQANQCLDEQWDSFQDALMKSNKFKLPTMETVYQSMVKQTKTLQKQKYMLKHISARIKASNRTKDMSLLNATARGMVGGESVENLEEQLSKLQVQQNAVPQLYNRLIESRSKLNGTKVRKVQDVLVNREASRVCVSKTQLHNSTLQLSTLFAAPLSPIGKKTVGGRADHLINSTPKPKNVAELKMPKVPVQTFTPTTQAFGSGKSLFMQAAGTVPPQPVFDEPGVVPVPGPGNTSSGGMFPGIAATTAAFGSAGSKNMVKPAPALATTAAPGVSSGVAATTIASFSTSGFAFSNAGTKSTFGFGQSTTTTAAAKVDFSRAGTKPPLLATPTTPPVAASSMFGTAATAASSAGSFFGGAKTASGMFGTPALAASTTAASVPSQPSIFASALPKTTSASSGDLTAPAKGSAPAVTSDTSLFGSNTAVSTAAGTPGGLFGSNGSIFGKSAGASASSATSIFGGGATFAAPTAGTAQSSLFGGAASTTAAAVATALPAPTATAFPAKAFGSGGSSFGAAAANATSSAASTPTATAAVAPTSVFGAPTATSKTTTASLFGSAATATTTPAFGIAATAASPSVTTAEGSKLAVTASATSPAQTATGIFAAAAATVTPAPATTKSLFGTTSIASTVAPSSGFGSFGTTTTAASATSAPAASATSFPAKAFGSGGSIFAAAATNATSSAAPTSLFGTRTPATATVAPTSVFGAPAATTKPTTAPLFGSATTATTTPAFGTATTAASPFGGTSSGFGLASAPSTPPVTSAPPAFGAVTTTVPAFGTPTTSAPIFGSTTTTSAPIFGSTTTTSAPAFGSIATTTAPAFGATTTSASAATAFRSGGIFGGSAFGGTSSVFAGAGTTPTTTSSTPPAFGSSATTASPFASSPFTPSTTTTPFGGTTSGGFSSSGNLFAQPAKFASGGSIFGGGTSSATAPATTTAAAPAFGSSTSVFGSAAAASSPFGGTAFGSSSNSPFAATTQSGGGGFGSPSTFGSGSAFGGSPAPAAQSPFASPPSNAQPTNAFGGFGGLSVGGGSFKSPTASPATNPFGAKTEQKSPFGSTTANLFATPTSTTSGSMFGASSTTPAFGATSSAFGNSSFGQSSSFGNASFGATPTGAFSGGNQSVQQAGFGAAANFQKPAFGSAPVFGAQPAFGGSPSFGAAPTFGGGATFGSPGKVFGGGASAPETSATPFGAAGAQSSTFGSIAQQNTVGFGNLAQQAAAPSSTLPFSGGSSFTNWRN